MGAISIFPFNDACGRRNGFKKTTNHTFPVVEWLFFVMQYITVPTEPLLRKTLSAPRAKRK